MLGVPVPAATAAATAATFFALAFHGTIAGLALLDCGKGLLLFLPRRPWWLLLTVLLRFALALFLIAVASLVATTVHILARTSALLVALVAVATTLRTAVPMVAALPWIAASLRFAWSRFDRFGLGLGLACQPAENLIQNRGFRLLAGRCHGRRLSRRNALHGRLRSLRFGLLHGRGGRRGFSRNVGHLVTGHGNVVLIEFVVLQPGDGIVRRLEAGVWNQQHVDLEAGFN